MSVPSVTIRTILGLNNCQSFLFAISHSRMKPLFVALVLLLGLQGTASAEQSDTIDKCPPASTDSKSPVPPSSARKVEFVVPPITVTCGSVTVIPPNTNPKKSEADLIDASTWQWDKIIDALAKLLGSIAWPVAGTYIALLFRKELAALLARLKRGKIGTTEFEFGESIRKIEPQADAANLPRLENSPGHEQLRRDADDLFVLARSYPRAAVFEAWVRLEVAVGEGLRNSQVITDGEKRTADYQLQKGAQILFEKYPKQFSYFNSLRNLRNKVAHGELNAIDHNAACAFIELAFRLVLFIEITWPNAASQRNSPANK